MTRRPSNRAGKRQTGVATDRPGQPESEGSKKMARLTANLVLRPTVNAAITAQAHLPWRSELDLSGLTAELDSQVEAISQGNMERPEAMLVAQAHTLDAVFNELARRSRKSTLLPHMEAYLRLALRAQNQSRATIETLALLKNPPNVSFVGQANFAHGPQQVINARGSARERETETSQNKLLEQSHGERLDGGTSGAAGAADPTVAALEEVHRPEDGGREGSGSPKRR